jgi:hypothetical protein
MLIWRLPPLDKNVIGVKRNEVKNVLETLSRVLGINHTNGNTITFDKGIGK